MINLNAHPIEKLDIKNIKLSMSKISSRNRERKTSSFSVKDDIQEKFPLIQLRNKRKMQKISKIRDIPVCISLITNNGNSLSSINDKFKPKPKFDIKFSDLQQKNKLINLNKKKLVNLKSINIENRSRNEKCLIVNSFSPTIINSNVFNSFSTPKKIYSPKQSSVLKPKFVSHLFSPINQISNTNNKYLMSSNSTNNISDIKVNINNDDSKRKKNNLINGLNLKESFSNKNRIDIKNYIKKYFQENNIKYNNEKIIKGNIDKTNNLYKTINIEKKRNYVESKEDEISNIEEESSQRSVSKIKKEIEKLKKTIFPNRAKSYKFKIINNFTEKDNNLYKSTKVIKRKVKEGSSKKKSNISTKKKANISTKKKANVSFNSNISTIKRNKVMRKRLTTISKRFHYYYIICNRKTINEYKNNEFLDNLNKDLNEKTISSSLNGKIYNKKNLGLSLLFIKNELNIINNKRKLKKKICDIEEDIKNDLKLIRFKINKQITLEGYISENRQMIAETKQKLLIQNCKCNLSATLLYDFLYKIKLSPLKFSKQKFSNKIAKQKDSFTNLDKLRIETTNNVDDEIKKSKLVKLKLDSKVDKCCYSIITNMIVMNDMMFRCMNYQYNRKLSIYERRSRLHRSITIKEIQKDSKNNPIHILKSNLRNKMKKLSNKNVLFKHDIPYKKHGLNLDSAIMEINSIRGTFKLPYRNKNASNFSILHNKKFFNVEKKLKIKDDDESHELNLDEKRGGIQILENYKSIEDVYLGLVSLIIEGENKLFMQYFTKHRLSLDINAHLIEGNTMLIISCIEGNAIITKFLCEQGCETNIQNNYGNTALHYAIANQYYVLADILERNGAREDILNYKGLAPWDCIENNLE